MWAKNKDCLHLSVGAFFRKNSKNIAISTTKKHWANGLPSLTFRIVPAVGVCWYGYSFSRIVNRKPTPPVTSSHLRSGVAYSNDRWHKERNNDFFPVLKSDSFHFSCMLRPLGLGRFSRTLLFQENEQRLIFWTENKSLFVFLFQLMCSRWNATSEYTNNEAKTSLLCRKVIVFTFLALVENSYYIYKVPENIRKLWHFSI